MLVYIHGAKCIGIRAVPVIIEVNITVYNDINMHCDP